MRRKDIKRFSGKIEPGLKRKALQVLNRLPLKDRNWIIENLGTLKFCMDEYPFLCGEWDDKQLWQGHIFWFDWSFSGEAAKTGMMAQELCQMMHQEGPPIIYDIMEGYGFSDEISALKRFQEARRNKVPVWQLRLV